MTARMRHSMPKIVTGLVALALVGTLASCGQSKPVPGKPPAPSPTPVLRSLGAVAESRATPLPENLPSPRPTAMAAAASYPRTLIIEYLPQRPEGAARPGSCLSNSLVVPSKSAWRCIVDETTLDPCFSLDSGSVVCDQNPLTGRPGILIGLVEPLPSPDLVVEQSTKAWLLQLEDGTICRLANGATGMVGESRISYVCSMGKESEREQVTILGETKPGPVWTAQEATLSLQDGRWVAKTTTTVALKAIVRGPMPFVPYACGPLVDSLGDVLGADARRSEAPFTDPASDDRGVGCQITVNAPGTGGTHTPLDLTRRMLMVQGWHEDTKFNSADQGRSTSVFRAEGAVCLVSGASAQPSQSAPDALAVRRDYVVALNCARNRAFADAATAEVATERIQFGPNGTMAMIQHRIVTAEVQRYIIRALEGQLMIVDVTSPQNDVFVSTVEGANGTAFLRHVPNSTHWQGRLPATGDYVVTVVERGDDSDFQLSVIVPATLVVPLDKGYVQVEGEVDPRRSAQYLLHGTVGQTIAASVSSSNGMVFLVPWGSDGARPPLATQSRITSVTMRLQQTRDYVLEVAADTQAQFTLKVAVQ